MEKTIQIACRGALTIVHTELVPFQGNLKSLSEEDYLKLSQEIRDRGFSDPISIWQSDSKNFILNGHQRLRAVQRMEEEGWKVPPLPVSLIFANSFKEAKMKLLGLASQYGKMEAKGLYEFIMDTQIDSEELFACCRFPEINFESFKTEYFEEIYKLPLGADDDEVPDAPVEPKTKKGDIYLLGEHRVMCGDSTLVDDVEKLMNGSKAEFIFTDPPYNVNYDPEARHTGFSTVRLKNKLGKIQNDRKSPENFRTFLDDVFNNINLVLADGASIYVCHADTEGHHFRSAFVQQPWNLQSCLIWKKTVLVFGRADYHWIHEPILYGWKEGASHSWHGDRKQTSVVEFATDHMNKKECDTDGYVHPTQKPVSLISYCLENSSQKPQIILDPFLGSGSTMIACEKLGRRCYGMELDPKYVDVIVSRWEKFTGRAATLVGQAS
jgi:DNA modification methylase